MYRIHQFEKQEMIVVCKPEESMDWYEKMWRYSVELFRSMDIPVRQLEVLLRRSGRPEGEVLRHRGLVPPAEEIF